MEPQQLFSPIMVILILPLALTFFIIWIVRRIRKRKEEIKANRLVKRPYTTSQIFRIIGILVFMLPIFWVAGVMLQNGLYLLFILLFGWVKFQIIITTIKAIFFISTTFLHFACVYLICEFIWPNRYVAEDRIWRVEKPSVSLVHTVERDDGIEISLPPGGLSGGGVGLAFFAVFWNTGVWFMFCKFLAEGIWFVALILVLFVLVGIKLVAEAVQLLVGTFTLRVDPKSCTGTWKIFGLGYSKKRNIEDIINVDEVIVYTLNTIPHYGVGIHFKGAKALEFGSTLSEDERKWLVGEIRQCVKRLRSLHLIQKVS